MTEDLHVGNIVTDLENPDSWGFVLRIDEEKKKVAIYDQLIDYIKTVSITSVKKIHNGVEHFNSMFQETKINNVVNPNISSVDSFQAPICELEPYVPIEYEEIPSLEVNQNLMDSALYCCNIDYINRYYVSNPDICRLLAVYSITSTFIPSSIYNYYNSNKLSLMCQPVFNIFTHYMSPEVKTFQINNLFTNDSFIRQIPNWSGHNNIYIDETFGCQKEKDNITLLIPTESLYLSFYSIYMSGPFTYISYHIILRDSILLDHLSTAIDSPLDHPITYSESSENSVFIGHYINVLQSLNIYIPDSIQYQRYNNILIQCASIYFSSLHVPSFLNQVIPISTPSVTLCQPFIYIAVDNTTRRYLQSRYIYLDNEPHDTSVSSLEDILISLDRNSDQYKFDDNLLDLIEEFQARGGEVIFQSDDAEISEGVSYKDIYIEDGDVCIPICHEGMNRSQVLYSLLLLLSTPSYPPYIYVYTSHGALSGWDLSTEPLNENNYYKSLHSDLDSLDRNIIKKMNRYTMCYNEQDANEMDKEDAISEDCRKKVYYKERGGENDHIRYNNNDEDTSLEGYYRAFGMCKQPRYGDLIGRNIPLNVNIQLPKYEHIQYNRYMCHEYFNSIFYHQFNDNNIHNALKPFNIENKKNHIYYFCFARSFQSILKRLLSQIQTDGNTKDMTNIRLVWLPIPDNINTAGSEEDINYWQSLGIKNADRALLQANSYIYTFKLYSSFIHTNIHNYIPRNNREKDNYNEVLKTEGDFFSNLLLSDDIDIDTNINDLYAQILDLSKIQLIQQFNEVYSVYKDQTKNNNYYVCVRINKEKFPYIDINRYKLIYEYYIKSHGIPSLPLSHIYSSISIQQTNYDLYMFGPIEDTTSCITFDQFIKQNSYQEHKQEYCSVITSLVYELYNYHTSGIIYNNINPNSILLYKNHIYLYDYTHALVDAVENPLSCLQISTFFKTIYIPEQLSQEQSTPLELYTLGAMLFQCLTSIPFNSLFTCTDTYAEAMSRASNSMKEQKLDDDLISVIESLLVSDIPSKLTSYELLKTNKYFDSTLLTNL